jgi:HEAT repeat protein
MTRPAGELDAVDRRILALVTMAAEGAELEDLHPYLADPHPQVRCTAIDVLTESVPEEAGPNLAAALGDDDAEVRAAAIVGLSELREVIVADPSFAAALERAGHSADGAVRAAVVRLLREHRLGTVEMFSEAGADPDPSVRRLAVAGLVSLDAVEAVAGLRADTDPLVRIAVGKGLAAVGDPSSGWVLEEQASDPDIRVRAAALEALATLGCAPRFVPEAVAALEDGAWEVRKGAVLALGATVEEVAEAVDALLRAVQDENRDVRKAAVQSLGRWARRRADVRAALASAQDDPDADVRGYARLALA